MLNSSDGITADEFLDCLRRAERFGWRYATLRNGIAYVETGGNEVRSARDKKELEMLLGLADD